MKLLIEIPEEIRLALIHNIQLSPDQKSISNSYISQAIICGKPLDDVLDEIRAEFKSKEDGDDWYHTTDGLVWGEAMEIIDKHRQAESEGKE